MKVKPFYIFTFLASLLLLIIVYMTLPIPLSDKIQIMMVVSTFLAVLVALFQENLKRHFDRVKLKLEINLSPPDCHQIDLTDPMGNFMCKCIYLRVRVSNLCDITARNAEIIVSNLWRVENNEKSIVKTFLPMNLRWSHTHPTKVTIPPKSFRFCDLGPVRPLENSIILKLETETQPNPVSGNVYPNIINPGEYILELLLSGDNVIPKLTKWNISFENNWSNDEKTMLERIKISQVK